MKRFKELQESLRSEGAETYTVSKGTYTRKVDGKTADLLKKQGWKLMSREEAEEEVTEGFLGKDGEKGRDIKNAGLFDKETAYSLAKKVNGVIHKDPKSDKYHVKHGKGSNVSEESVEEADIEEYGSSTPMRDKFGPVNPKLKDKKDPKKDSMVVKNGKTIVIDKSKEKEYLRKGWTLAEAELDEFGGRGISAADKENLRRRIKDKKKKESVEEDVEESTAAYAASLAKIAADKQLKGLTPKDREMLVKLAALMAKEKK